MGKFALTLCLALFGAGVVPAVAQNTFDPSWTASFRHGFWDQMGRTGVPMLFGGVRYLTMPYSGPFPTNYAAPAGCQIGYACVRQDYVQQHLVYLGRIYVPVGKPGNTQPTPPALPVKTQVSGWQEYGGATNPACATEVKGKPEDSACYWATNAQKQRVWRCPNSECNPKQ
ncbi:MAG: hypothetical protein Q7S01_00840 [bacterium]|nr:hypothetical protein [bacterium]